MKVRGSRARIQITFPLRGLRKVRPFISGLKGGAIIKTSEKAKREKSRTMKREEKKGMER